jgi:hypothetical protein
MKKALLLVAVILGTSVMVNAQTEPAKAAPAKEVKATKHDKKAKAEKKADKKAEAAPAAAAPAAKPAKK